MTWTPLLGGLVLFTALHWCLLRWVDQDFRNALKLSRGIAAVLLTGLGLAAAAGAAEHWRSAFVYRHDDADWMRAALLVVYGHFVADLLWMIKGRWRHGVPMRVDLVVHHLLGVVAFSAALVLKAGYALGLLVMLSEVLPVSSGLKALGKTLGSSRLAALADRAHLHSLLWLRLPVWTLLLVLTLRVLMAGDAGTLLTAYQVVAAGLVVLIGLDVFWVRECLDDGRKTRRQPDAG